jgi:hypothetical protein
MKMVYHNQDAVTELQATLRSFLHRKIDYCEFLIVCPLRIDISNQKSCAQ